MKRMQEISVVEYLGEVASPRPTPGGGSAAAFCGALGAALTAMVAGLTVQGEKFKAVRPSMEEIEKKADELSELFLTLAEEDAEAYLEVSAAWKLPRKTEAETNAREAALQEALKKATRVPLETLRAVETLLRRTMQTIRNGNPHARGDAGAASTLAHAGAVVAFQNIRMNLTGIRDASFVKPCAEESLALMNKIDALASEANREIQAGLP